MVARSGIACRSVSDDGENQVAWPAWAKEGLLWFAGASAAISPVSFPITLLSMTEMPFGFPAARFACRPVATAFACAWIVTGWLWATSMASGQMVGSRTAGDEMPVRVSTPPPRFGYYRTQWRRWPDAEATPGSNTKAATPATPAPLEIPGVQDESPPGAMEPLPQPDRGQPRPRFPAAAKGPPPVRPAQDRDVTAGIRRDGLTLDQRSERLARQAAAAKAGSREQQTQFTRQLVAEILATHDPELRIRIVATAAEFDTPDANAICTGALQDPSDRVRMAACAAWGRRGGPTAVQLLATRYETDAELGVRLRALSALAELDDGEARAAIARALDDSDPVIRNRAMNALRQASGRDFGNDVDAWRSWAADPDAPAARWSWMESIRKLF